MAPRIVGRYFGQQWDQMGRAAAFETLQKFGYPEFQQRLLSYLQELEERPKRQSVSV